ncbi:MAG: BolA family transcriptional regulator [Legionellales bacterium]|nr:BolA family transcriptional regulator [Legionellales bacterium]
MNPNDIQRQIENGLPNASVHVDSNDNIHFVATIISDEFTGLSRLAQHRLIYSILAEDLKENIHALQLITKTPEENK